MSRRRDDTARSTTLALRDEAMIARDEQKARGEELLARIKRNMTAVAEAFFEIGEALVELHNNKLYRALGFDSFAEMLQANGLMSAPQATKLLDVATHMPREAAIRLGKEKSHAVIRYARVSEVPVKGILTSGRIDGQRLDTLSLRDLDAMTRTLRGRTAGTSAASRARSEARKLARQAQAALRKGGLAGLRVDGIIRRGQPVFRFELDDEMVRELLKRF